MAGRERFVAEACQRDYWSARRQALREQQEAESRQAVTDMAQQLVTSGRIAEMADECRARSHEHAAACVASCEQVVQDSAASGNLRVDFIVRCESNHQRATRAAP
jgi:hypothetical protein